MKDDYLAAVREKEAEDAAKQCIFIRRDTLKGTPDLTEYLVDRVRVCVWGEMPPLVELAAYVKRGRDMYRSNLIAISLRLDGDEVNLDYTLSGPTFERIRRITGYLVGSTDRFNNAKRAEEHDRVKHEVEK